MKITKLDFVEGAKSARGITVIIDVFRAFTTACYAFEGGAEKIIPAGSLESALGYQPDNPEVLRVGERHGQKLPGFDFGNSPTEIVAADVRGKTLVQTTHSGTQGMVNAKDADEILTGALVNAKATADYIRRCQPAEVSLVRMGWTATTRTGEDDLCAEYLEALLLDKPFDTDSLRDTLYNDPCADRFKDPEQPWSPMADFELCCQADQFDFALRLNRNGAFPYLEKIPTL
ncbi:MAG: hypothetical protein AseanaTS_03340 [Candidatus Pelagadaptatus aseana]|uniref:2-phosphosulfolactate phosphatase n=1 Tax=Candidatus Pelagadaptatus aseana TaxID=3120508 RepID=UPI0039B22F26